MSEPIALFLGLGIGASVLLAVGFLLMKSRAAELAPAEGAGFLRALAQWFSDCIWLAGLALQLVGYALYLVALTGAPVSMLAVMMQAGTGVFVLFSVILFHERASIAEWVGIAGVFVAMVLLGASLEQHAAESSADISALVIATVVGLVVAGVPYLSAPLRGVASAFASGIVFGLASLYAKAMMQTFATEDSSFWSGIQTMLTAWPYLAAVANFSGLVLLQNSFHWSRGIVAMPLSSALSNLVPIVGGMLAFGEHLPAAAIPAAMRIAAFALTIASAGLLAAGRN